MLNLENLFQNTESEPYSKAFNRDSSPKFIIEGSIRQRSSWRFWQCKKKVFNCFHLNTTVTHGAYTIFELMTEFVLTKWLNFSCSLLSNLTPIWSCIENSDLCFDLKNCLNRLLDKNCLIDWFSSAHGVSKVVQFPNTNRKERILEAFCSVRKFL